MADLSREIARQGRIRKQIEKSTAKIANIPENDPRHTPLRARIDDLEEALVELDAEQMIKLRKMKRQGVEVRVPPTRIDAGPETPGRGR